MKVALIALGLLALTVAGFIFVGGSAPYITVPPDHLWDVGGYTITNTVMSAWVTIILLVVVAAIAGPRMGLVPSGFSGAVEAALSAFYDFCISVAGEQNARRFLPLVGTIFFYILLSNWIALLPGFKTVGLPIPDYGPTQSVVQQVDVPLLGSFAYVPFTPEQVDVEGGEPLRLPAVTAESMHLEEPYIETTDGSFTGNIRGILRPVHSDITAPLAIALFSFVFVEFWGIQSLGLGYLKKFFAFDAIARKGVLGGIDIFVGILELASELSRIISFTFRLFGNIFAGSVLMLMMPFLTPFVLVLPFYGLELFVGAIQAFVFAVLTLVFAMSAISHHGDDHPEGGAESAGGHAEPVSAH
ncbi:MAG: F0F1 ATP synthase subunit A [Dehalococcoidia bacterium]|nr:F0F1 ATP synthase subunit A [Dehalococcoidia bacterium]